MRLLTSVDTEHEATELELLMHASGIPVFVQSDHTRTDPANRSLNYGFLVHVWIEEQFEDAVRLLADPAYIAPSAVDVQKFFASLDEADAAAEAAWPKSEEKLLNWLVGLAAAAFLSWAAYRAILAAT